MFVPLIVNRMEHYENSLTAAARTPLSVEYPTVFRTFFGPCCLVKPLRTLPIFSRPVLSTLIGR
jgi:hypothetical protein